MTTLLHVSASPRGAVSESLALAERFLAGLRESTPDVDVEHWDLWDGTLPDFGPAAVEAKMAVFAGADPEGDAAAAWRTARAAFERLVAAATCSRSRRGTTPCRTSSSSSSMW